ncbi:FAD-dependent oxidoreductase [Cystobacter fuscus]|uniref:FAD-dependent oxidoreductase n=1 Tax=Cystobacter fuscus TaxID=43 RepID=UPI0037BF236B
MGAGSGGNLLGDAAHLAAPNGEGANLAMYDGAELGKALAAHPGDVEATLTEYAQALFPRGTAAATDGTQLHEFLFGDNAPHRLVTATRRPHEPPGVGEHRRAPARRLFARAALAG